MWAVVVLFAVSLARADEVAPSLRGSGSQKDPPAVGGTSPKEEGDASDVEVDGNITAADTLADAKVVLEVASRLQDNSTDDREHMDLEALFLLRGGWYAGGDKMWGSGVGVESITPGNVGYYDAGMRAARSRCGGAGCALIVNPPGHRSVYHFHIHFVHYQGYGASLKHRLESKVCGRPGWHGGHLPCHGKAAFFPGFPGVFSKAMMGGGLGNAGVIAWPRACGGSGTIVQLAYGCSIEHQIRGDYNPRRR